MNGAREVSKSVRACSLGAPLGVCALVEPKGAACMVSVARVDADGGVVLIGLARKRSGRVRLDCLGAQVGGCA